MWLSEFTCTPQKEEHTEQRNNILQNKDLQRSICNTKGEPQWNIGGKSGTTVPLVSFENSAQDAENIATVPLFQVFQLFHVKKDENQQVPCGEDTHTPVHILAGYIHRVTFEEACQGKLIPCPQYHWHWLYKSWCVKRCTQRHKDCIFERIKKC